MKKTDRIKMNASFVLQNPKLIFRLVTNYAKIFLGYKLLRSVEIDLTYDCQCNCRHCYASRLKSDSQYLTPDEIKKTVDQCVELGAIHFLLSGGEVLLDMDRLCEVIKHIHKRNAFPVIATNGILLDIKNAKRMKEAGLGLVIMSLDHVDLQKHDNFRNYEGCSERLRKAMTNCKEVGLQLMFSTVFTHQNLNDNKYLEVVRFARQNQVKSHFCFPVRTGNWSGSSDVMLRGKDWDTVKKVLDEEKLRTCEQGTYLKKGCSAGTEKISVTAYGDVMPCPYIHITYGNVKDERLSSILQKMRMNEYFGKIHKLCLPSYNQHFINKYLNKVNESEKLPLPYRQLGDKRVF